MKFKTGYIRSGLLLLSIVSTLAQQNAFAVTAPRSCPLVYTEKAVEFRKGNSVMDAFRSNANDYWSWTRTEISKYMSDRFLAVGLVTGDPHAMNFGDLYLQGQRPQVTLIDIDDSGRAPFLADFARLLTAIKVSGSELKAKDIWQNYLDGLNGDQAEDTPGFVKDLRDKTHADWLVEQKEYVEKNTVKGRFNKESLELKPLNNLSSKDQDRARQLIAKVSELYPGAVVKDAAYKVKESGGSQGLLRIWILVTYNGADHIGEFKEMATPATEYFEPQLKSQKERLEKVTQAFWHNADPMEYKVVSIDGGDFWLRPRYKYELKFNPEKIDSDKKQERFDRWNLYIAYVLGRLHGSQNEAAPLRKALQKNDDQVLEQIKAFSKAYRQRLGDKSDLN